MRVLITGATGFLGGRLTLHVREAGFEPKVLVRKSSNTDALDAMGVEQVVGDFESGAGLERAIEDVDAVVHCAGGGVSRRVADLYKNNTQSTEALLNVIERVRPNLSRLVHVSSIAAQAQRLDSAVAGPVSSYGRSKAEAEKIVLAAKDRLAVTVLRPPAIYGPGDMRMLPLFRAVNRGLVLVPSSIQRTALIHVDDCCQAIVAVLSRNHPSGRTYAVSDGEAYTAGELIGAVAESLDRHQVRVFPVPSHLVKFYAALAEMWGNVTQGSVTMTRDKAKDLVQANWSADITPIRQELRWGPEIGLMRGIMGTALWYKEAGWIPR